MVRLIYKWLRFGKIKKFDKFKRPIDFLPHHPYEAIREVWGPVDLDYQMDELEYAFFIAMSTKVCVYAGHDQRKQFVEFYCDLIRLVEATYIIYERREKKRKRTDRRKLPKVFRRVRLNVVIVQNPIPLIKQICDRYALDYIEIELGHFVEAVIAYHGRLQTTVLRENIVQFTANLLCLWKACCIIVA